MRLLSCGIGVLVLAGTLPAATIGLNVVLNAAPTGAVLQDLARYGKVLKNYPAINAVTMRADSAALPAIRARSYVLAANPDAERKGSPISTVQATDFTSGLNSWNLDAVNVTERGMGRVLGATGEGVYVAVLDTGLLDSWRKYFPTDRIATKYAKAFGGGGGEVGNVTEIPNKWEHDQDSHGTHVTSTILGYSLNGTPINGVAPKVKVIPVKVLNQNNSGWSAVVAEGILYIARLKKDGALGNSPVVINMSLGGSALDVLEKAAIDYAIDAGVVIVASAGNEGDAGMGYPGAYAPVISVAATGWTGQWIGGGSWWSAGNVADPTSASSFYIADFSSRQKAGQDLDVAAPGAWVVGPYQVNSGQTSYYYLSGTSMASPHVAGIVALMLEKKPTLTASDVEYYLEKSAIALPAGCADILEPAGPAKVCWKADATGSGIVTADEALKQIF